MVTKNARSARTRAALLSIALPGWLAGLAAAQETRPQAQETRVSSFLLPRQEDSLLVSASNALTRRRVDPVAQGASRAAVPALVLSATSADQVAKIQLGTRMTTFDFRGAFATPVDKEGEGKTVLTAFDGLRDKAYFEAGFSYPTRQDTGWLRTRARRRALDPLEEACNRIEVLLKQRNAADQTCWTNNPGITEAEKRQLLDDFKRYVEGLAEPIQFGAAYKWGRESYEYVDASGATQPKARRASWEGSAAVGSPAIPFLSFAAAEFAAQRSYKAGDEVQLCTPVGTTGTVSSCKAAPLGAPVEEKKRVGRLILRRLFEDERWLGVPWGVEAIVSRDFEGDVTGVQVPVYFLPDDKGALNGGAAALWDSKDHHWQVMIFVGTLFKTLLD